MKSDKTDFRHKLAGYPLDADYNRIMNIIFDDEVAPILRPAPKQTYIAIFKKAEQRRPLSEAFEKIKSLEVMPVQIEKLRECLNNAVASHIKQDFPTTAPRIDYNDKYFLGHRINRQAITATQAEDIKNTFSDYFSNALGWSKAPTARAQATEEIEPSVR